MVILFSLTWHSVSLPFISAWNNGIEQHSIECDPIDEENKDSEVPGTENKSETKSNSLSDYLHNACNFNHNPLIDVDYIKAHEDDAYKAFHPELVCPPPEIVC